MAQKRSQDIFFYETDESGKPALHAGVGPSPSEGVHEPLSSTNIDELLDRLEHSLSEGYAEIEFEMNVGGLRGRSVLTSTEMRQYIGLLKRYRQRSREG